MNCTLPFKSSLDNSKHFLTEVTGALSEDFSIIDSVVFDKAVDQLEQESIKSYGVSGKSWIRDITQDNLSAIPNLKVLDKIDQKRKELGLYDKQLSGSDQSDLGEEFIPIPEDNQVVYKFRLINALESDKVRQPKLDNLQGFINDISKQGVSNQQIDMLKDTINKLKERNQPITKQDLITELLVNYSYGVEVNIALQKNEYVPNKTDSFRYNGWYYSKGYSNDIYGNNKQIFTKVRIANPNLNPWDGPDFYDYETEENISKEEYYRILEISTPTNTPTQHYSNLTVPGGTNYREIELRTPGITPSITGHADFATKEGIGWARLDDKIKYNNFEEVIEIMKASGILKIEC